MALVLQEDWGGGTRVLEVSCSRLGVIYGLRWGNQDAIFLEVGGLLLLTFLI
jgi:hypothetical protein